MRAGLTLLHQRWVKKPCSSAAKFGWPVMMALPSAVPAEPSPAPSAPASRSGTSRCRPRRHGRGRSTAPAVLRAGSSPAWYQRVSVEAAKRCRKSCSRGPCLRRAHAGPPAATACRRLGERGRCPGACRGGDEHECDSCLTQELLATLASSRPERRRSMHGSARDAIGLAWQRGSSERPARGRHRRASSPAPRRCAARHAEQTEQAMEHPRPQRRRRPLRRQLQCRIQQALHFLLGVQVGPGAGRAVRQQFRRRNLGSASVALR